MTILITTGCVPGEISDSSAIVWGNRGFGAGEFITPRAITINPDGEVFVVDKQGRIQVFSKDGEYIREWRVPEVHNGKPCGLGWSNDGLLMVADTHYFRILFYQADGTLVKNRTIGGVNGRGDGEFGFVTDIVQGKNGEYYVSEYGDNDRIQRFGPDGKFRGVIGSKGEEPGMFNRPQSLAIDSRGWLWVTDGTNHRVQAFDISGDLPQLMCCWGEVGTAPGFLRYPYGLWIETDDSIVVTEFGNHRLQRFDRQGRSLGIYGGSGREPGLFSQPWGVCKTADGEFIVIDSYNDRIQKFSWNEDSSVSPN